MFPLFMIIITQRRHLVFSECRQAGILRYEMVSIITAAYNAAPPVPAQAHGTMLTACWAASSGWGSWRRACSAAWTFQTCRMRQLCDMHYFSGIQSGTNIVVFAGRSGSCRGTETAGGGSDSSSGTSRFRLSVGR